MAVALAVLLSFTSGAAAASDKPQVTAVRLDQGSAARVVVDLSAPAEFRVYPLGDPPRMVIDVTGAELALPGQVEAANSLIAGVRVGQPQPGMSRITLDLTAPAPLERAELVPGEDDVYTLIVDLDAAGETVEGVARATLPLVLLPLPPRKPAAASGIVGERDKPLIVLDAGHGGIDPGAIGASGVEEKSVTLAMAKLLRELLLAEGRYRVQLTRQDDRFIPLRERFELAQRAGASLFVSLHADSHKNPLLRGASVYTLSEKASDAETAALAAKENKSDLIGGVEYPADNEMVGNILLDLTRFETLTYSGQFAKELVRELARDTLLLRNTHRSAGFAVLKAPDIPSVLVELGYLSNPEDESLLQSKKHKTKLARAIVRAIKLYFERHPQEARLNQH